MPRVEASTWTMTSHMHRCVRLAEEGALGCRRPLERDAANNPSAALPGVAAVCKPYERDELILPFTYVGAGSSRRRRQLVNRRVLLISICCVSPAADSGGHDKIGRRMDAGELQEATSLGAERALAETESSLNTFDHSRAVDRRSRSARSEARRPDGQHHWGEQRAKQRNHG